MRKLQTLDFKQHHLFGVYDCPHIGCSIAVGLKPPRFDDIWDVLFDEAWSSHRCKSIPTQFGGIQNHQFSDVVAKIPVHAAHDDLLGLEVGGFDKTANEWQNGETSKEIPSIHTPRISHVNQTHNFF